MKTLAVVLLVAVSRSLIADSPSDCTPGTGMHFDGSRMVCDSPLPAPVLTALPNVSAPAPAPDCIATQKPGMSCTWPSNANVVELQDLRTMGYGKAIALIDGPIFTPISPTAIRGARHLLIEECWVDIAHRDRAPVCFRYELGQSLTGLGVALP